MDQLNQTIIFIVFRCNSAGAKPPWSQFTSHIIVRGRFHFDQIRSSSVLQSEDGLKVATH